MIVNSENIKVVSAICPNCGANIVGSSLSPALKCHWCKTTIPANLFNVTAKVPDYILPFKISKEEAKNKLNEYVETKKKFAKEEFINNINSEMISPIYLPYMLVDVKAHISATGISELILDKEQKIIGRDKYNVGVYDINREFDLAVDNLLIESSPSGTFNQVNSSSNVVSAVSPFDTENCVKFNANYLNGYTSENREFDIIDMNTVIPGIIDEISQNILEKEDTNTYERGILWNNPTVNIIGTQWNYAYIPIWLYSYQEKDGNKIRTYYIAINGRTGKTVGSIPANEKKIKSHSKNYIVMGIIALLSIFLFYSLFLIIKSNDEIFKGISSSFVSITSFLLIIILLFYSMHYSEKKYDIKESLINETQKMDYVNNVKYKPYNMVKNDIEKEKYITGDPNNYNKTNISVTIYK